MSIAIDKGIEVPPVAGRKAKYPFAEMAVGDSFFIEDDDTRRLASQISVAAFGHAKRHGGKFITRQITKSKPTGVRCWRVE